MQIAKEDLLWIREYVAEKHGKELTPQQVLNILNMAKPVEVVKKPGLRTLCKLIGDQKWPS